MQKVDINTLLPPLSENEYEALKLDIASRGVQVPIEVDEDGNILDGFHRVKACKELGKEEPPRFRRFGMDEDEKLHHALTLNLVRRHLTREQRDNLILRLTEQGWTQEQIAQPLGITQGRVAQVLSDKSCPHININNVDNSHPARPYTVTYPARKGVIERNQRERSQIHPSFLLDGEGILSALEAKTLETKQKREQQTQTKTNMARNYQGSDNIIIKTLDCLEAIATLKDNSIGLLLTDPPYHTTTYDWDTWPDDNAFQTWRKEWLAALRPKMASSFTAFIFCDPDDVCNLWLGLRATDWPVIHQVIWYHPNIAKKRSSAFTFQNAYTPFWHCGNRRLNLPEDWSNQRFDIQEIPVPQSNFTLDRSYHPAQKPLELFRRLIRFGSDSNDLVVDPFCGAGTTAVACQYEDRRCFVSDQAQEFIDITKGRLTEFDNTSISDVS